MSGAVGCHTPTHG
ncbi:hypothetical protein LINPERPRIM_LOCUS33556 [Linum perenne]